MHLSHVQDILLTGPQTTDGASEEVHETEQRRHSGRLCSGQTVEVLEVGGEGVVHGQLDAEASGVLGKHDP